MPTGSYTAEAEFRAVPVTVGTFSAHSRGVIEKWSRGVKANRAYVPALVLAAMSLSSCAVIKDIFKAGVWVGALAVLAVVGLVVYGLGKLVR
jgi:hypothetical protein